MEKIEIGILLNVSENEDSLSKIVEQRIEPLSVSYFLSKNETIYRARFINKELDSKFGEIEISYKEGFWPWLDDSSQNNIITNKVIEQLILNNI